MARQTPTFSAVRSEGGLLPPDLLQRIVEADADLKGFAPADYGLGEREPVREAISRAWSRVKAYWPAFRAATDDLRPGESGVTETREQWMLPLLRTLGYRPEFRAAAEEVEGRRYLLSHRDGPVAVHIISCQDKLDEPTRGGDGRRMNPHALLQEYLNRSESRLYGIVTNGKTLRLLRDNFSLTRLAYLEFDLEAMLEGGVYADFVLLWLALHRTRLPASETDASSCWLETWRAQAETQGTRAMGELRKGVELALAALGSGLLAHPANEALRARLKSGDLTTEQFYAQLLRLLYRLLFLFVTEERDLLFAPADEGDSEQVARRTRLRDRYLTHYSLSRLRDIARRYADDDRHDDLWRGLALVFDVLAGRREGLGLASLGGGLFSDEACPDIDAGALISNRALAQAVAYLSTVRITNRTGRGSRMQWRRVNYRDIDVEELGGVYEGLLERQPSVVAEADNPHFDMVASLAKKQSGSYYTPSSLVQELIKSALDPVIEDRLAGKLTVEDRRAALLGITVCDTAAGSGHFLLAAARRIADRLARVLAGDREPSPPELRHALRETIRSCIYGVDLNPLAVDLCRLALWLEGHEAGRPMTFLDHRIKCGNSLIGATPDLVREGIPDGAFDPVTGDDRKLASALKRRNRPQRASAGGQQDMFSKPGATWASLQTGLARTSAQIGSLPQDDAPEVAQLRAQHDQHRREVERARATLDAWTAAFFWPLPASGAIEPPLSGALNVPAGEPPTLTGLQRAQVERLRDEHRFFHWHLEFPEVFDRGGFDCVLGNPPWDKVEFDEEEFFHARDPKLAAFTSSERKSAIGRLHVENPALYQEYGATSAYVEAVLEFVKSCGRFPLTGRGRINLYALFAEHNKSIVGSSGLTGLVLPTGIVTDDSTKLFFQDMILSHSLVSFYSFFEIRLLFPDTDSRSPFALMTTHVGAATDSELAFYLLNAEQLRDELRRFRLNSSDFMLMNPNTETCPSFRTNPDAEISRDIYRRVPVLVNERTHENSWGISISQGLFNVTTDKDMLYEDYQEGYVAVYEGFMVHMYDHRFSDFDPASSGPLRNDHLNFESSISKLFAEHKVVEELINRRSWDRKWIYGARRVTRGTDERTLIGSIFPRLGATYGLYLFFSSHESARFVCFIGCMNSLVLDFLCRAGLSQPSLTITALKQLPVLPPSAYTRADLGFIVPRVLELTYTAWDLKPFAEDLGYDGPPFVWDEGRRAVLRAELDAYYASLYGLTRDELSYILDPSDVYGPDFPGETFRVLKNNDIKRYGEFRTQRLVLEAWDRLGLAPRNRDGRYDPNAAPVEDAEDDGSVVLASGSSRGLVAGDGGQDSGYDASALLEFAVENRFPHPIARAFYQLRQANGASAEATQLANIVGVLLEYLALVSIASYLAGGVRKPTLDATMRELFKKPIVHGNWARLLREVLEALRDASTPCFVEELSTTYYPEKGGVKGTNLQALTDDLVTLRNRVMKQTAGELPPAAEVRNLKRLLLRTLQAASFLVEYPLVAVRSSTVSGGVKTHDCRLLAGFHDAFSEATVQTDLDLERDRVALLKPRTGEVLYLDPMFSLRQCSVAGCDREHLFVLESVNSKEAEYIAPGGHKVKDRPAALTFDTALSSPGIVSLLASSQHLYVGIEGAQSSRALPSGHHVGRKYEVTRQIGHGGMADVYEARRLADGALVALKLFPPELLTNRTLVARFQTEVARARELDHPNIARFIDYGHDLFELYLVMELAEGWRTSEGKTALDAGQLPLPLSPNLTIEIASQACEALDRVHKSGIVHRDVKPGNLLLFAGDRVKLGDFGIARARDQMAMTMTGLPIGTPEYMSPEQADGAGEPTSSSDIYSLGIVLYELLTGSNPFKRSGALATMAAQANFQPPPPSTKQPSVPKALDAIVMRCLLKDPAKRYRSARELYQELTWADR